MNFKFEDLEVYKKSLLFTDLVYISTKDFPKDEVYGLTSQFRRAAVSIALNIAEGSGGSKREFSRYLGIAANSLRECIVCITIAERQQYISSQLEKKMRADLVEIVKMISGLKRYLEKT
ncbi:four helix bundle protein [Zunongwangia sp. F260]|uniref:Four helix bundle protein n=2 Tax=Autumnicola TaxID=3160927 RepID=A0ABU3CXQ2_9FLAO|nr:MULTISPECIES: four helix bundle protein [unclassified Zunongwangia]MDT0647259.1 four helix bundle protein [Zunongwangia sp. F260]MDT0651156.1 four helix bundle protein [Zunongwangia sp. F297]